MMVICSFCGNHMYAGAVQGHIYKYLTYRCGNKYCSRTKKSIRGKVIFDFIYDLLGDGLNFGEKEYKQYLAAMKEHSGSKREEIEREIHSKEGQLKIAERSQHDLALKIPDFEKGTPVYTINVERVNELQGQIDTLKADIVKLREQIGDPEQDILTLENFLNLCKNAGKLVQTDDPVVKDSICRLLFLNLSVDNEKVLSYQAKPEFEEMLKSRSSLLGRG